MRAPNASFEEMKVAGIAARKNHLKDDISVPERLANVIVWKKAVTLKAYRIKTNVEVTD